MTNPVVGYLQSTTQNPTFTLLLKRSSRMFPSAFLAGVQVVEYPGRIEDWYPPEDIWKENSTCSTWVLLDC